MINFQMRTFKVCPKSAKAKNLSLEPLDEPLLTYSPTFDLYYTFNTDSPTPVQVPLKVEHELLT